MRFKTMLPLLLAGSLLGAQAQAEGDKTGILVGVDARQHSWYSYAGVTQHFGEHAYGDGLIARVVGFSGQYRYASTVASQGRVDGDYTGLEAMLGYQKVFTAFTLRGYAGLDYEGHQLSPANRFDGNSGGHVGGKVRLDVESDFAMPNYVNLIATYSSARDRYWVRARGGRDFSGFVVGPEILATGDHYAHEERYGVFVNVRHFLPALLSISAGQARTPAGSAGVTPYATMEFSMTF